MISCLLYWPRLILSFLILSRQYFSLKLSRCVLVDAYYVSVKGGARWPPVMTYLVLITNTHEDLMFHSVPRCTSNRHNTNSSTQVSCVIRNPISLL